MSAEPKKRRLVKPLPPIAAATFGERMADHVAAFGGSWAFIMAFFAVMAIWIIFNTVVYVLHWHPFDPYPFILFNLILSCLAAIQAPIIMMSQNRMETRDRTRNEVHFEMTSNIAAMCERVEDRLPKVEARLDVIAALLRQLVEQKS